MLSGKHHAPACTFHLSGVGAVIPGVPSPGRGLALMKDCFGVGLRSHDCACLCVDMYAYVHLDKLLY